MTLRLCSFNVKGFKPRNYDFIVKTFKLCDIMFLQETWLYNHEQKSMENILPDANIFLRSSMDVTDIDRQGRPYGGCAIAVRKSLNFTIEVIITSPRLCAIKLQNSYLKFLIFSLYMPVNNNTFHSHEEFGDVLSEISAIAELHDSYQVIVAGDFNVDVRSFNSNLLNNFIDDDSMFCTDYLISDINRFTFESSLGHRSHLDHFIISESLRNYVDGCEIIIDGSNLSDHNPVCLTLKNLSSFDIHYAQTNFIQKSDEWRIDWAKADDIQIDHYNLILDDLLHDIELSLINCENFRCIDHFEIINNNLDRVVKAMLDAANLTIPKVKIQSN